MPDTINHIKVTYVGYNWRNLLVSICVICATVASIYHLSNKDNNNYVDVDLFWTLGLAIIVGLIALCISMIKFITVIIRTGELAQELYMFFKSAYDTISNHIRTIMALLSFCVIVAGIVLDITQSWEYNVHLFVRMAILMASSGLITYCYVKYNSTTNIHTK